MFVFLTEIFTDCICFVLFFFFFRSTSVNASLEYPTTVGNRIFYSVFFDVFNLVRILKKEFILHFIREVNVLTKVTYVNIQKKILLMLRSFISKLNKHIILGSAFPSNKLVNLLLTVDNCVINCS